MTFNFLNNKYIDVDPQDEVVFRDVPKKSSISILKITNTYSGHVLFKIKTTAPNTYIVRPNLVILSPGETSEVQLYMKPSDNLPSITNFKDRFMIIATDITGDPRTVNTNTIWGEKPADSLQQIKLRAAFKPPSLMTKSPASHADSIVLQEPRNSVSVPKINLNDSGPDLGSQNGSINSLVTIESKKKPSLSINRSNSPDISDYPSRSNMGNSQMGNSQMGMSQRISSRNAPLQNNSGSHYKSSYFQTNQFNADTSAQHLFASPATVVKSANVDEGKDFKKEYERLLSKVEEQEKQLLKVSEERNYVYNELLKLKDNLARKRAPTKNPTAGGDHAEFQIFHVIIVAVVSLLLGAFFSV